MHYRKNVKWFFVISALLVFISSFSVIYLFERHLNEIKLEEIKENEKELLDFQGQLMGTRFKNILGDLHYLNNIYGKGLYTRENFEMVKTDWLEFSIQRQLYDQIRYLDSQGEEIIRVNYENNSSILVDKSQLQNKADRYYFIETKNLERNEIFVSPLDLNIENNEIEDPYKPMIRFSTPIYDEDDNFQGIIILNYLGNYILDDFKDLSKNSFGDTALLNSDSFWLSCEDESNEWNFMFDDKKDLNFAAKFPKEWKLMRDGPDQVVTENGLFTFSPIQLNHNFSKDFPLDVDPSIKYVDSNWYMVSLISPENDSAVYFVTSPLEKFKSVIGENTYLIALMFLFSLLVGYLVYINRLKYYRIKYISEYDPLTKTLNRRAGYRKITDLITKANKHNTPFSLCFIDVNGLKLVNDNLGHDMGDNLLKNVTDCIKLNIRDKDFIIRLGGDEFLIILDGINKSDSEKVWTRIKACYNEINKENIYPYLISVSHGIVQYNKKFNSKINTLIQIADEKMYNEKQNLNINLNVLK